MSIVVWDSASESVDDLLNKIPESLEVDLVENLDEVINVIMEYDHCSLFLDYDSEPKKVDKLIKQIRKKHQDVHIYLICNSLNQKKIISHQKSKTGAEGYLRTPLDVKFLYALLGKVLEEEVPEIPAEALIPKKPAGPPRQRSFESVAPAEPSGMANVPNDVKKLMEPYGLLDEKKADQNLNAKIQNTFDHAHGTSSQEFDSLDLSSDDGGLDLGSDDVGLDLGSDDVGLDLGNDDLDATLIEEDQSLNLNDELDHAKESMSAIDLKVFEKVINEIELNKEFKHLQNAQSSKIQNIFNTVFINASSGESTMADKDLDDELLLDDDLSLDADLGGADLESSGDLDLGGAGDLDLNLDGGTDLELGGGGDDLVMGAADDSSDGGLDMDLGGAGDLELGGSDELALGDVDDGGLDLRSDDGGLDLGSDDGGLELGDDGGLDLGSDDSGLDLGADDSALELGGDDSSLDMTSDDLDAISTDDDLDLTAGGDLDALGGEDLVFSNTEEVNAEPEYEVDETGRDNRPITGVDESHVDNALAEIEAMMADESVTAATMDATGDIKITDDLDAMVAEDDSLAEDLSFDASSMDDDLLADNSIEESLNFDQEDEVLTDGLDFSNAPSDDDMEDLSANPDEMDATQMFDPTMDDILAASMEEEEPAPVQFQEAPFKRPGQEKTSTHVRNARAEIDAMMADSPKGKSSGASSEATDIEIKAPSKKYSSEEVLSQVEMVGFHNEELGKLAATIKNLREERIQLISKIEELEHKKEMEKREGIAVKAELDEKKIELSLIKKRFNKHLEEAEYRAQLAEEKQRIIEEKHKTMKQELDKVNQKVRFDIKKIQARENELENQLELLRADSEVQIKNRDQRILELKRKIDSLEFDLESIAEQEKQSKEENVEVEEKMEMVMKTLRSAITILEGDEKQFQSFDFLKKKNMDI